MALENILRHPQLAAQVANLVLKQLPKRLQQLQLHVFWQTTHVMVGLDVPGRAPHAPGLDDVRVEGPLGQKIDGGRLTGHLLEGQDKLPADYLALLLRIGHPFQLIEEPVGIVKAIDLQAQPRFKESHHLIALIFSQEAVVDEHAYHLLPQGSSEEGRHHRTVHPARDGAQHPARANRSTDALGKLHRLVGGGPIRLGPGDMKEEIGQHGPPIGCMLDLRVELGAENRQLLMPHRCDDIILRPSEDFPFRGDVLHPVAVAHPDRDVAG